MFSRFSIWLMLSVFLFNSLGIWVLIEWEQAEIHEASALSIRNSTYKVPLQVITVTDGQVAKLKWEEEGKEFFYNNCMYDVVRMEKKGNTVSYFCIADTHETNFVAFLDRATQKDDVHERLPFQGASKKMFITSLYLLPTETISFIRDNSLLELPRFTSFYSFDFYKEKSPPPRISVV